MIQYNIVQVLERELCSELRHRFYILFKVYNTASLLKKKKLITMHLNYHYEDIIIFVVPSIITLKNMHDI